MSATTTETGGAAPRWTRVDQEGYWHAYGKAAARMDQAPTTLTAEDIEALELTDAPKAERARHLRAAAIAAAVPKPAPERQGAMSEKVNRAAERAAFEKAHPLEAGVAAVVAFAIKAAIAPLKERIAALEARPRGLSYEGVWRAGAAYETSDCVTDHGGLWIAERPTTARPGDLNSGWRLAVKRGSV